MGNEEIIDDVAERVKVTTLTDEPQSKSTIIPTTSNTTAKMAEMQQQQQQPSSGQNGTADAKPATAEVLPGPLPLLVAEGGRKRTVDEVVAEMKRSPFFMTELEENDETEAFKALAYEGTPSEVASDFKERGNECFRARRWADAKEFYSKGILVLQAEERKRRDGQPTAPDDVEVEGYGHDDDGADGKGSSSSSSSPEGAGGGEEWAVRRQRAILEALLVNRAACHLELRNHRSCWLDGAAALRLNDRNVKAYYRSARALLAAGRAAEAEAACAAGLAVAPANEALRAAARDAAARSAEAAARAREQEARRARDARRAALLAAALAARGIRARASPQGPPSDLPDDARVALVPDPDDPRSELSFPAVLLYPAHLQSDFVKSFRETDALADHLAYVLPPPWDRKSGGEYVSAAAVECYAETVEGGLVKVGKKAPLLRLLASGRVEVVDGIVRLFVLPRARAEAWVREFKAKKAAGGGRG